MGLNLSTESDIDADRYYGFMLILIGQWLSGVLVVLIIILRITVKTTTNYFKDRCGVESLACSRAFSPGQAEVFHYFTFRCYC